MLAVLVYSEKQMEILSRERREPVCGPDPQPPPQGPFTMLKALSEPQHMMVLQVEKHGIKLCGL